MAEDYLWSSARGHLGLACIPFALDIQAWEQHYDAERWRKVLATSYAEEALDKRLRQAIPTGKPFADSEFLQQLAARLSRDMTLRRRGRPPSGVSSRSLQAGAGPEK